MSFTARHHSLIIGTGPMMSTGTTPDTLTAIEEQPQITDEGFDSLRITYVLRRPSLRAEELAALLPVGSRLGSRNWWITGARPQPKAPGLWLAEVDFKGWAAAKPMKIRTGSAAAQASGKNVSAPTGVGSGSATYAQIETFENTPTLEVSYLQLGGLSALSARVSTVQVPPVALEISASIWASLGEFVWHWPQGWVLMACNQDRLAGTEVALVTDSFQYIRPVSPA